MVIQQRKLFMRQHFFEAGDQLQARYWRWLKLIKETHRRASCGERAHKAGKERAGRRQ